jgi:hypothetical protein
MRLICGASRGLTPKRQPGTRAQSACPYCARKVHAQLLWLAAQQRAKALLAVNREKK